MSHDDSRKWDKRYGGGDTGTPSACEVLADFVHLLPADGRALELACGRGGNALLLAARGLETHARDISRVALDQLASLAAERSLDIKTRQCDLTVDRPEPDTFDVIVVSYYLDRELVPFLIHSLRQEGLLFYQTFITEKADNTGPGNPDYLLKPNELLDLFSDLHKILYREEGLTGDVSQGFRNRAMLIAQRRSHG